ncbi:MAG: Rrf2 family transcriptional regulator [Sulfurovum sp.]|nr:Rrf2 family transcriptional regulator [Sulfurovum sp.]MCB4752898.1 Rrf2 family transcriptional regulator [Sulfurovum sp.]MCB4754311.1 Rrf2 family transcriptional regulator [Sulfurovum sp.]MCB4758613.1 Rrf2 family transcriptional regulator [Sulfurovum sp.]MCB4761349.1 Rrf2 family transcriptional regulator [Sulfurovum sp.]
MIGISTKTIYAVAALRELENASGNDVLKIKEIAARASIPQNFLEQILLELRKQGILLSIKGAHGGYKLAKNLKDITLKDIVMILEVDAFGDICRTGNMVLKLFWEDIQKGIEEVFCIPLSELNHYEMRANETFNYSI